ncbi:MAG TPA: choice-of-anchor tandem repeat GloVer-containing protein [Rhizomicrobium sp.]|jgi:uncharacterized repeat protein (TIGR03803 family)|nr:choice-of-anchor tandem repeat GloVer-containing protein [Rhizomicrobium sp.]
MFRFSPSAFDGAALLALTLTMACPNSASAEKLKVVYKFQGGDDGSDPEGQLIRDGSGTLYGTTYEGGDGFGTIFKISPDGKETQLYKFQSGEDGANPEGSLVEDAAGNFYGTTFHGGGTGCNGYGCGVAFMLGTDGTESVLFTFDQEDSGAWPVGGVISDSSGNLYGTTGGGGANGWGTVFELSPSGKDGEPWIETVLYSFGWSDGAYPYGKLVMDPEGDFLGTTNSGGANGVGVVFKLTKAGAESILYSFSGKGGSEPYSGVILDASGNLYGTTFIGGHACAVRRRTGCGVIFELSAEGREKVLHAFTDGSDGGFPSFGNLVADTSGNLYGATEYGGSGEGCGHVTKRNAFEGCGVIFEKSAGHSEKILHAFDANDGVEGPSAGLIMGSDSNLYGTTAGGNGAVFELRNDPRRLNWLP